MTTTRNQTEIAVGDRTPTVRVTRDFDAPRELVFRAWTDPALVAQWLGPRSIRTDVTHWDCRRGGSWAYSAIRVGSEELIATFYGSFHEVREPERLVQTFTYEGAPDGVSLETLILEELPGGRTRSVVTSLVESFEVRDQIIASGMGDGMIEGYEKLDDLLTRLA